MKYQVLAIANNGNGHVQSLGVYDNVEGIEIYTNIIAPNVKIVVESVEDKI